MDQATVVEKLVVDSNILVDHLRCTGFDVSMAYWERQSDGGGLVLHIVTKEVDQKGLRTAYAELRHNMQGISNLSIDPFQIKLLGTQDQVVAEAKEAGCRGSSAMMAQSSDAPPHGVDI